MNITTKQKLVFQPFAQRVCARANKGVPQFDPITILAIIEICLLLYKGIVWLWNKIQFRSSADIFKNPDWFTKRNLKRHISSVYQKYSLPFSEDKLYQAILDEGSVTSDSEIKSMAAVV
jgi:hypothetical protein